MENLRNENKKVCIEMSPQDYDNKVKEEATTKENFMKKENRKYNKDYPHYREDARNLESKNIFSEGEQVSENIQHCCDDISEMENVRNENKKACVDMSLQGYDKKFKPDTTSKEKIYRNEKKNENRKISEDYPHYNEEARNLGSENIYSGDEQISENIQQCRDDISEMENLKNENMKVCIEMSPHHYDNKVKQDATSKEKFKSNEARNENRKYIKDYPHYRDDARNLETENIFSEGEQVLENIEHCCDDVSKMGNIRNENKKGCVEMSPHGYDKNVKRDATNKENFIRNELTNENRKYSNDYQHYSEDSRNLETENIYSEDEHVSENIQHYGDTKSENEYVINENKKVCVDTSVQGHNKKLKTSTTRKEYEGEFKSDAYHSDSLGVKNLMVCNKEVYEQSGENKEIYKKPKSVIDGTDQHFQKVSIEGKCISESTELEIQLTSMARHTDNTFSVDSSANVEVHEPSKEYEKEVEKQKDQKELGVHSGVYESEIGCAKSRKNFDDSKNEKIKAKESPVNNLLKKEMHMKDQVNVFSDKSKRNDKEENIVDTISAESKVNLQKKGENMEYGRRLDLNDSNLSRAECIKSHPNMTVLEDSGYLEENASDNIIANKGISRDRCLLEESYTSEEDELIFHEIMKGYRRENFNQDSPNTSHSSIASFVTSQSQMDSSFHTASSPDCYITSQSHYGSSTSLSTPESSQMCLADLGSSKGSSNTSGTSASQQNTSVFRAHDNTSIASQESLDMDDTELENYTSLTSTPERPSTVMKNLETLGKQLQKGTDKDKSPIDRIHSSSKEIPPEHYLSSDSEYFISSDIKDSQSSNSAICSEDSQSMNSNKKENLEQINPISIVSYPNNQIKNNKSEDCSDHLEKVDQREFLDLPPGVRKGKSNKNVEKLTSDSWTGQFLSERNTSRGSDESITFIFMSKDQEEEIDQGDQSEISQSQNIRNMPSDQEFESFNSDLSNIGLSAAVVNKNFYSNNTENTSAMKKATSLDSLNHIGHQTSPSKWQSELQRTSSLGDIVTQETEDILERGRRVSPMHDVSQNSQRNENFDDRSSDIPSDSQSDSDLITHRTALQENIPSTTSEEDDIFANSPSPERSYGQQNWSDFQSLILGRPKPPPVSSAQSSPQLYLQPRPPTFGKKSVSWTDLQGCGELTFELPTNFEKKGFTQLKSIMKKQSVPPLEGKQTPENSNNLTQNDSENIKADSENMQSGSKTAQSNSKTTKLDSKKIVDDSSPILENPKITLTHSKSSDSAPNSETLRLQSSISVESSSSADDIASSGESSDDTYPKKHNPQYQTNIQKSFSLQLPDHIRARMHQSSNSSIGVSSESIRSDQNIRTKVHKSLNSSVGDSFGRNQQSSSSTSESSGSGQNIRTNLYQSPNSSIIDSFERHQQSSSFTNKSIGSDQNVRDKMHQSPNSSISNTFVRNQQSSSSISESSGSSQNLRTKIHQSSNSSSGDSFVKNKQSSSSTSESSGIGQNICKSFSSSPETMYETHHYRKPAPFASTPTTPQNTSLNVNSPDFNRYPSSQFIGSNINSNRHVEPFIEDNNPYSSAPLTPDGHLEESTDLPNRWKSEGDLRSPNPENLKETWVALSKVMQEAGTILKTLSETSLVYSSPSSGACRYLPPVFEEGNSTNRLNKYASIGVQTEESSRRPRTRSVGNPVDLNSLRYKEERRYRTRSTGQEYSLNSPDSNDSRIPQIRNTELQPNFDSLRRSERRKNHIRSIEQQLDLDSPSSVGSRRSCSQLVDGDTVRHNGERRSGAPYIGPEYCLNSPDDNDRLLSPIQNTVQQTNFGSLHRRKYHRRSIEQQVDLDSPCSVDSRRSSSRLVDRNRVIHSEEKRFTSPCTDPEYDLNSPDSNDSRLSHTKNIEQQTYIGSFQSKERRKHNFRSTEQQVDLDSPCSVDSRRFSSQHRSRSHQQSYENNPHYTYSNTSTSPIVSPTSVGAYSIGESPLRSSHRFDHHERNISYSRRRHDSRSSQEDTYLPLLRENLHYNARINQDSDQNMDLEDGSGSERLSHASTRIHRHLDRYQQRVEDSWQRLDERLQNNARRRHLRSQLLSTGHNRHGHHHTHSSLSPHGSLDYANKPFGSSQSKRCTSPFNSSSSLHSVRSHSPVQSHISSSPCCCISPSHHSHHSHHSKPTNSCCSHSHHTLCHCHSMSSSNFGESALVKTQQCREQLDQLRQRLAGASRLSGSSSSLTDSSPSHSYNRGGNIHRMQSNLSVPYQRSQAASLTDLSGRHSSTRPHRTTEIGSRTSWRHSIGGSVLSVASENDVERRWAARRVADSDSDSGAGFSSSGYSLKYHR